MNSIWNRKKSIMAHDERALSDNNAAINITALKFGMHAD